MLPENGFSFICEKGKNQIDWSTIDLTFDMRCFEKYDLYYAKEIHKCTHYFLLCAENMENTYDMLSPFRKCV